MRLKTLLLSACEPLGGHLVLRDAWSIVDPLKGRHSPPSPSRISCTPPSPRSMPKLSLRHQDVSASAQYNPRRHAHSLARSCTNTKAVVVDRPKAAFINFLKRCPRRLHRSTKEKEERRRLEEAWERLPSRAASLNITSADLRDAVVFWQAGSRARSPDRAVVQREREGELGGEVINRMLPAVLTYAIH